MKSSSPRHGISERLTEIMYDLQQIRKDTGVPMIAMSQVGRDPQKARKAPVAADTFGSASIEQTADMLGFLWREEISAPEKKEVRGLCDLMLRKNREGEVGTIHMHFIGWKQYFEEIVR
jgi:replicative DNA helicase